MTNSKSRQNRLQSSRMRCLLPKLFDNDVSLLADGDESSKQLAACKHTNIHTQPVDVVQKNGRKMWRLRHVEPL